MNQKSSSDTSFIKKTLLFIIFIVAVAGAIIMKFSPKDELVDARDNRLIQEETQEEVETKIKVSPEDPHAWEKTVILNDPEFGTQGAFMYIEDYIPSPYYRLKETDGPVPKVRVFDDRRFAFFLYGVEGELRQCPQKDNVFDLYECKEIPYKTKVVVIDNGERYAVLTPTNPLIEGEHYALRFLVFGGGLHITVPMIMRGQRFQ